MPAFIAFVLALTLGWGVALAQSCSSPPPEPKTSAAPADPATHQPS
jgi:hypothetical protein